MLKVKDLVVIFDGFRAITRGNLFVGEGDILAVIGPNGAGKTTFFNAITGQLKPDAGEISFKGKDITGMAPHLICRKGISRSFQVTNIFPKLTVFENVQAAVLCYHRKTFNLFSSSSKLYVKETMDILDSIGLASKAEKISGMLSHGDQKGLETAIALANRPEMLILDEPTAGMSPEETSITIKLIKQLSEEFNLTILICEHDMGLVFSVAKHIMVMSHGISLIQDIPEKVRKNKEVIKAYFGGSR